MPLKTCGSCGKKVGPRLKVCECGHSFEKKVAAALAVPRKDDKPATPAKAPPPAKPETPTHAPARGYDPGTLRVYIPAGDCPAKLKGTDIESVAAWGDTVKQHYRERHQSLSTAGLLYFARKTWGDNPGFDAKSDEYATVREHILQLYGNS